MEDLGRLAGLLAGAAAAAVWPRRWDPGLVSLLCRCYAFAQPRTLEALSDAMARRLPQSAARDPRRLAEEHIRMRLEDLWGRMRGVWRFGWRPKIEIEGLERVHQALGRGRGVILWSMRFSSATTIKQVFHREGLPLVHLSAEDHGSPSGTWLGIRTVSPLFCRAENPYLAERVKIPMDGSVRYLAALKQRLRENACLSIFGEHQGLQNAQAKILGVPLSFALGGPSLAWTEQSALLTVYALRLGTDRYRVIVDEEIAADRSMARKDFAFHAVEEFARRLEGLIIRHPADWQGWLYTHVSRT